MGARVIPGSHVGVKYNKLLVVEYLGKRPGRDHTFKCACECGGYSIVELNKLLSGRTKGCGCLMGRVSSQPHKPQHYKRLYTIWRCMKGRCNCTSNSSYKRYGARGVYVCEEWSLDFKVFYEWAISNGYAENLTLDREDNEKGYEPLNCRWATMTQQQNNKSNNVYITYNGVSLTVKGWSERTGINAETIRFRYKNGWPLSRVFSVAKYISVI